MPPEERYRVSLTSAEVLAAIAALRALDALITTGAIEIQIAPGILASAAGRMATEVPEFVADQAAALSKTVTAALSAGRAEGEADEDTHDQEGLPVFPIGSTRRLLEDAWDRDVPVEIEYFSASREAWTTRRVAIDAVYENEGNGYLSGHCGLRDDHRLFRLDRIRSVRVLDAGSDPFTDA